MKNKEGKEESSKRGTTESEKRTKGWPIKWKRKNLEKMSKSSLRSLLDIFSRFFLFHFIGHLSLPFFRSDHPSLTWFFFPLFILRMMLLCDIVMLWMDIVMWYCYIVMWYVHMILLYDIIFFPESMWCCYGMIIFL